MIHLYITFAYILLTIYPFFRIKAFFIGKGYKRWYIAAYMLIAAIFPLAGRLWGVNRNFMLLLSDYSGYLLPFYLYLFIAVLLFDVFLIINALTGILSPETRKKFSFRCYTLSVMILLPVAVVVAGAINLNTIRVSKYSIEVPRKQGKRDHLRIAFLADLHIMQNSGLAFIQQFKTKVTALNPDILLYGGDIIEGNSDNENINTIELVLKSISTKYGTYGIPGNHEYYQGRVRGNFYRKAGIELLCDTAVRIDSAFYLAGRWDQQYSQRKTIARLVENLNPDLPVILMDHRPTQLQEASRAAINVTLSGHTHNGQLFPINYIVHRIYELSWGYKKIRDTHCFVTCGLRLWGPPVKTAGKSEIMLIDIDFRP